MTILVLGNATVDLSYEVHRLPVPGETLIAKSKLVDAGGKGLNQAVVAHRAGASVRFCAPVGNDPAAQVILQQLETEGLSSSLLHHHVGATDESLILVSSGGENAIVSTSAAARSLQPGFACEALGILGPGDILLMQGNLSRSTTFAALESARSAGLQTLLNPAPITFDYTGLWPLVDVVILNEIEATLLGGTEHIDSAAKQLLAGGCGCVVVTLGAAGARLYDERSDTLVPAPKVTPVDTTGAGDVVCGVLAAGIADGMNLRPALSWAVSAASLSVTRRGTGSAFPTRAELANLRAKILVREAPNEQS